MATGLPQIATFSMPIGAGLPTQQSIDITGRSRMMVDRIQAFLRVDPSPFGAVPDQANLQAAEALIRVRVALDRNDRRVLTNGDVPVRTFQQLQGGPLPVPPFELGGNEQPTMKVSYNPNVLQMDALKSYGACNLEIIFYGQEI